MKKFIWGIVLSWSGFIGISSTQAQDCDTYIDESDFDWTMEAENSDGEGRGIAVDSSGNSFMTGEFAGGCDVDPLGSGTTLTSWGQNDGVIAKYNNSGSLVWAKQFGSTTGDESGRSIAVDSSGNIYVAGSFEDSAIFYWILWLPIGFTSYGGTDAFVAKLDSSGNYQWLRRLGGTGNDSAHDLAVDTNGNVYVAGHFTGTADFNPGSSTYNLTSGGGTDGYICKLDSSGNFSWARRIGGTSADVALGVAVDSGTKVFVCGYHRSSSCYVGTYSSGTPVTLWNRGGQDIFVTSYSKSSGYVQSAAYYGGADDDVGYDLAIDTSGNVYFTGYYQDSAKFSGTTLTSAGTQPEAFICKLNNSGTMAWAKSTRQLGGAGDNMGVVEAYGIAVDASGCNVYATGRYVGDVDFDPSSSTDWLTEGVSAYCPNYRVFIWSLTSDGDYSWTDSFGDDGVCAGNDIAVNGNTQIRCTGYFDEDSSCSSSFSGDLFIYKK